MVAELFTLIVLLQGSSGPRDGTQVFYTVSRFLSEPPGKPFNSARTYQNVQVICQEVT